VSRSPEHWRLLRTVVGRLLNIAGSIQADLWKLIREQIREIARQYRFLPES
jgi:hypothetical protein